MTAARNLAAGGAKRGGKTAVPKLRAAAEAILLCDERAGLGGLRDRLQVIDSIAEVLQTPDLKKALADLRAALEAEKNASVGYAPEPFDWFVEEGWCVDLLFEAEAFDGEIVDPACGMGTIVAAALAAGYYASGSDLVDRPRITEFPFRALDFFGPEWDPPSAVYNIVCNPPFSYQKGIAERFIRRALSVARGKVAMLLPVKFNSSNGRHALFTGTPLARIYTLSSRPSMPPGSLLAAGKIKPGGGKVDYAWFVWDQRHTGPATNHYLIHPDKAAAQQRRRSSDGIPAVGPPATTAETPQTSG